MGDLAKRSWHYLQKPQQFDIACPLCKSTNLDWSEYEDHIWCYDCKKDLDNYESPLSGLVPVKVALMLGISFDRYNMISNKIERYDVNSNSYIEE